ncbi:hypothetical protein HanIR_Chr16g0824101 [Helianthus annuus]|nr:hypothetical protein HanIR_Chr16g0824101 [Helianthus annuus]
MGLYSELVIRKIPKNQKKKKETNGGRTGRRRQWRHAALSRVFLRRCRLGFAICVRRSGNDIEPRLALIPCKIMED